MSDSESILPDAAAEKTPLVSDGGSMSDTKNRTIIEDTKSRSGSQPASQSDVVGVGTKLGPYELVRKLGQGGMGAVYEARHSKLNKTFALKVLPPGFASNEAAVTRFEREMQAIGQLDHPHIIKATDAGEWNGTHILVMEYVEGTDLSVLVKTRGPLSVRDACKAIRQAALGLQHAHEHGLVHRDIKPSNLFVTKSGQIKLLDLGLARLGDDGEQQRGLTSVGQILGTPDYMAPEQWDDTHSVDARADLYSLGCTLCFVLTGRAPYADVTKSSLLQLMKAHVEGAIPNLTDIRLDVPPELNAIFVRLLAKQAEDRYPNAAEVIAALEPFTRKGADDSTLTSKPVFAPGKEPPKVHAAPSMFKGQAGRDGEPSGQRSIKSLSASSTDDAFASDRPMIHGDSSTSLAETIIQPRAASGSRRRLPLIIGLSGLGLALLIGIAFAIVRSNDATDSVSRAPILKGKSESSVATTDGASSDSKNDVGSGWPADAPKPAIAPFNAEQAKKHQEEWAAYFNMPIEYENSIGMKFQLIPPGEFTMGYTSDQSKRVLSMSPEEWLKSHVLGTPARPVQIQNAFYLGTTEVTVRQFRQFIEEKKYRTTGERSGKGSTRWDAMKREIIDDPTLVWDKVYPMPVDERLPVVCVSVEDISAFCEWLGQAYDLDYDLPTEEQWEYACRAGTTTLWWAGDDEAAVLASEAFNTRGPLPVGSRGENPFGLFDTQANVKEWARSQGGGLVMRGGLYGTPPPWWPSAMRSGSYRPTSTSNGAGFRVSLPVKAAISEKPTKSATTDTTP